VDQTVHSKPKKTALSALRLFSARLTLLERVIANILLKTVLPAPSFICLSIWGTREPCHQFVSFE